MTVVGPFSQKVSDFAAKAKSRPTAVFREATKELLREAQTPQKAGGNMPSESGYLRASNRVSLQSSPMPVAGNKPVKGQRYSYSSGNANRVIDSARLGKDTIYIGWIAVYGRVAEARFGFARLAAQNWRSIVDRVAKRMEER